MGHTFKVADIERVCRSLGMRPAAKGSSVWRGLGRDGRFRQTVVHSHGSGHEIATGTARIIARQLLFETLEEMHRYLQNL